MGTPTPGGHDTPASYPPGTGAFSWDAVVQRLRELAIGEYEILHELGRGGMAAVFLAHEFALNRKVALKVMSPAMMMGDGMIDRFYSEAVTQANLVHPNIVGVHAVRQEEDLHYFVMQYVPGRSLLQVLRDELAQGRLLSIPVVRALVHQIGSALAFAHRRGVIHRDIKPANVLLNGHGDAVVTDFGIAKVAANPSQTMTGTVVGTAPYMSPEQCYALELTGNSDQYSLGILMYELLAGAPPFSGNSFVVMQAHALQEPAPLQSKRPDCPPDLAAAVMRMLAKATEDRFPDVGEAIAALGAAPASTHANDPVRLELIRLSDVQGVEAGLTGAQHVPLSPVPRTRRGSDPRRPTVPTPQRAVEATPPAERAADPLAQRIARLRLANPPSHLEVGESMRLTATASGADGSIVQDVTLRWSSSDPQVLRVRPETGEIEALSPGRADIVASAGDAVATVSLEISEATVKTIVVTGPLSVEVGDTGTITAEARDSRGARMDRAVAWSTADPSVARVGRDGTVTAVSMGTTKLLATAGGVRGELQLLVIRPPVTRIQISGIPAVVGAGESVVATAALFDKRGSAIDPRALGERGVRWESTDPGVLSVSATGGCKAVRPGSVRLAARADGAVAMLDVTVGVVPIARIDVTGIAGSMRVGASRRISVTASDAEGLTRQLRVEWSSSDPEVAAIETGGQLVARRAGKTTLRVQCGTMERSFPISVQEVVPLAARLREVWQRPGARIAAGVLGLAVTGLLVVAFLPDAPAVVDSSAPQSGGAEKTDSVPSPLVGGAEATSPTATVRPIDTSNSVPRVAEPPATARLSIGSSRQREMETGESLSLRATLDPPGVSTIAWTSSDPSVASVDRRSGYVTAGNAGTATIRASAGDGRDSISVIVRSAILARFEISGVPTTMSVGDSIPLSVSAFSSRNRPMAGSGATWHSSNPNVLSINPVTGVARGNAAGSTEIHVASATVRSRSWTVNVQGVQVAEPRPATVVPPNPAPPRVIPDPGPATPSSAALVAAAREAAAGCRDTYATGNVARIDPLARGGSRIEEGNRGFLLSTVRNSTNVVIASAGPLGEPELDGNTAHVRIPMRTTWRDSFRRDQSANLVLRAELQRRADAWMLASCRIVERR